MFQENKELLLNNTKPNNIIEELLAGCKMLALELRKGCSIIPTQTYGQFLKYDDKATTINILFKQAKPVAACAFGTISYAVDPNSSPADISNLFPWLGTKIKPFEVDCTSVTHSKHIKNLYVAVVHYNDCERKSREWIADWLDNLTYEDIV